MKKTVVLMTIVLALLAAPVFAEVTIGGDVDFGFSSDFASADDVAAKKDGKVGYTALVDDLDLDITATVDEFTTVEFSIEFDDMVGIGKTKGSAIPGSFKVKTDATGAFGVDGPVDVLLVSGYNDYFETKDYQVVSRIEMEHIADHAINKSIVLGGDVTYNDMFTVRAGFVPAFQTLDTTKLNNFTKLPTSMFLSAFTTIDALSIEAYFNMNDANTDTTYGNRFGATAKYVLPMDSFDLTFGAAVDMNKPNEDLSAKKDMLTKYAFSTKFVMGALDASVGFMGSTDADGVDGVLGLAFDAGYQVNDALLVYAGVKMKDLKKDMYFTNKSAADEGTTANAGAEFGAKIMAGATKYYVGYQMGAGKVYNRTSAEGMFFRVEAKY